jgi:hypothetical protein
MEGRIKLLGGEFRKMRQRLDGKSKGDLAHTAGELITKHDLPIMDRLERRTFDGMITWYAKNVLSHAAAWADMVAWLLKDGSREGLGADLLNDGPIGLGAFAPQGDPGPGLNEDPHSPDVFGIAIP